MGLQTVGLWVSALEVKNADVCLYSSRYQDYHNKRTLHKIHIPNMVCYKCHYYHRAYIRSNNQHYCHYFRELGLGLGWYNGL